MGKKKSGKAAKPGHPSRRQVLQHPQLRKGGVHQPSRKSTRSADKVALKRQWPQVSLMSWFTCGHFFAATSTGHPI